MQIFIYCKATLHVSGVTAPTWPDQPRWREVAAPVLWLVPEAVVTVFSTRDDGCCDTRNMLNDFEVNKYLHTVASGWIFINIKDYVLILIGVTEGNHENPQSNVPLAWSRCRLGSTWIGNKVNKFILDKDKQNSGLSKHDVVWIVLYSE